MMEWERTALGEITKGEGWEAEVEPYPMTALWVGVWRRGAEVRKSAPLQSLSEARAWLEARMREADLLAPELPIPLGNARFTITAFQPMRQFAEYNVRAMQQIYLARLYPDYLPDYHEMFVVRYNRELAAYLRQVQDKAP